MTVYIVKFTILCEMCQKIMAMRLENEYIIPKLHPFSIYRVSQKWRTNGALLEEITVNVRKMLKKFYWTDLLIWRSLKVALNRSIILKYMYEIVMTATSNRTYYHKVQDHSLPISSPA
jgi:hypothetical protein